jgi:hypothetical protein
MAIPDGAELYYTVYYTGRYMDDLSQVDYPG